MPEKWQHWHIRTGRPGAAPIEVYMVTNVRPDGRKSDTIERRERFRVATLEQARAITGAPRTTPEGGGYQGVRGWQAPSRTARVGGPPWGRSGGCPNESTSRRQHSRDSRGAELV